MGDMKTHFRGLVHGEFEEELDDIDEEAITRMARREQRFRRPT